MSETKKGPAGNRSSLMQVRNRLIRPEEIWPPVGPEGLKLCEPPPLVEAAIYAPPGASPWMRGPKDAHRFYERSRRQVKASEVIINNRLFNTDGPPVVVSGAVQWQFIFGRDRKGGGGGGAGPGGDGSADGQRDETVQVDLDELLDIKNLELPNMERKKLARTEVTGLRISGLDTHGTRGDWARKDSVRRFIKRAAALTSANPELAPPEDSEFLIDVEKIPFARRDNQFWTYDTIKQPIFEAAVYLLTDKSGSMTKEMLENAYLFDYLTIYFLSKHYKHIHIYILGHTSSDPILYPSWKAMVDDKITGGTVISPSLKWIRKHARENHPPQKVNCYLVQCGDGDNYSSDLDPSRTEYNGLIDDGFNYIIFEETVGSNSFGGWGGDRWSDQSRLLQDMKPRKPGYFHVGKISDRASVFSEVKAEFKKRPAKTPTV